MKSVGLSCQTMKMFVVLWIFPGSETTVPSQVHSLVFVAIVTTQTLIRLYYYYMSSFNLGVVSITTVGYSSFKFKVAKKEWRGILEARAHSTNRT